MRIEKTPRIHTLPETEQRIGYKAVTDDLKSLGLRGNTNIMHFPIGEWVVLPPERIEMGPNHWGGIWLGRIPSRAVGLRKHYRETYGKETRIFTALIDQILFINNGGIKTNAVMLLEEILKNGEESLR